MVGIDVIGFCWPDSFVVMISMLVKSESVVFIFIVCAVINVVVDSSVENVYRPYLVWIFVYKLCTRWYAYGLLHWLDDTCNHLWLSAKLRRCGVSVYCITVHCTGTLVQYVLYVFIFEWRYFGETCFARIIYCAAIRCLQSNSTYYRSSCNCFFFFFAFSSLSRICSNSNLWIIKFYT